MTDSNVYYYLDTSARVKRYAQEDGSARVQALCEDGDTAKAIAHIGMVEAVAALHKKQRTGELSEERCIQLVEDFLRDAENLDYVFVSIDERVVNQAVDLAQQHPLKGYDAVHLACALMVSDYYLDAPDSNMTFVAADGNLLEYARAEGLETECPVDLAPV